MQFPSSLISFVISVEIIALSVISSYSHGVEYNTHGRKIILSASTTENIINKRGSLSSRYLWAAFSSIPSPEQRKNFSNNGITINKFILKNKNGYVYKIKIDKNSKIMNEAIVKSRIIIGIDEITPLDKISEKITDSKIFKSINTFDSEKETIKAYVIWHEKVNEHNGISLLKNFGISDIEKFDSVSNTFIVRAKRESLIYLAEVEEINEILEFTIESPVILNARRVTLVDSLQKTL
jgi:hypothetical protein